MECELLAGWGGEGVLDGEILLVDGGFATRSNHDGDGAVEIVGICDQGSTKGIFVGTMVWTCLLQPTWRTRPGHPIYALDMRVPFDTLVVIIEDTSEDFIFIAPTFNYSRIRDLYISSAPRENPPRATNFHVGGPTSDGNIYIQAHEPTEIFGRYHGIQTCLQDIPKFR